MWSNSVRRGVIKLLALIGLSFLLVAFLFYLKNRDLREALAKRAIERIEGQGLQPGAFDTLWCKDFANLHKGLTKTLQCQGCGYILRIGKVRLDKIDGNVAKMDIFIPLLFSNTYRPFSNIPDHVAHHAAHLQLQSGKEENSTQTCLRGVGLSVLSLPPKDIDDFLGWKSIYRRNP